MQNILGFFKASKNNIALIAKAVVCGFLIASILSLCGFSGKCDGIRENVLRLHIIANSDSEKDQELKLCIRDAIQEEAGYIFDSAQSVSDAQKIADEQSEVFLSIARRVISENGFDYSVRFEITSEYFETRTYEDVTLPAGTYTAVKLVIGEGKGKNWWCVLFPCMCVPAAQESRELSKTLSESEIEVVNSSPKYEVRFKIVEWFQSIVSFF